MAYRFVANGEGSGATAGRDSAFTVTQINEYIRMLLDGNTVLRDVWVRGEISNFTNHYRTGHLYFSLKDSGGLIRAVMFRSSAEQLDFVPEDGMKVLLHGRVSSYVRDGQYQLYAEQLIPDGVGSLALAFEQLKRRLGDEGLFDPARKKPLPKYPRRIGLVTSPDGAAVRDMIRVAGRRFPAAELLIFPSPVQGERAAAYLAGGVRYFNAQKDDSEQGVDVIIIGRGGGSMEDLWAFNDEALARVVAASDIPIISAVGHEVDFTICDFVADVRAATPSAAAEIAVPDSAELKKQLLMSLNGMKIGVEKRIARNRDRVNALASARVLSSPEAPYNERRMLLDKLGDALDSSLAKGLSAKRKELGAMSNLLSSLSPLGVLGRGYVIAEDENGRAINSKKGISKGDVLTLKFSDGSIKAEVTDTQNE